MVDFQRDFSNALLNANAAVPSTLKAPNGGSAARRFDVYRNNVTYSLVSALADIYPTVQSLVGEEYFRAMARVHVEKNPPRSPILHEYGREFAAFLETFEPARNLPYLPDVARLDRLWLDAFHAADEMPLDGAQLALIEPEKLGDTRFVVHPATALLRSDYAAVSIVIRSREAASLEGIDPAIPEFGLVTRPEFDPAIHVLQAPAFTFTNRLIEGATLSEAADAALEVDPAFDLSSALSIIISSGAFTAITKEGGSH